MDRALPRPAPSHLGVEKHPLFQQLRKTRATGRRDPIINGPIRPVPTVRMVPPLENVTSMWVLFFVFPNILLG